MSTFSVSTRIRRQMVNVTDRIHAAVRDSGCPNGMLLATVMHTTCALVINDANSGWEEDFLSFVGRAVPQLEFQHLHDGPEHAKSHILGALLGPSLTIGIENGRPVLGTWQSVFLVELEGPRERKINLQVLRG
ncbi:MAG: YjbQ family protein [Armatimonadetes bacterium]|nr:YjbQ family protein [Armatimonadota bacterium]